jgi:hypothetical protein
MAALGNLMNFGIRLPTFPFQKLIDATAQRPDSCLISSLFYAGADHDCGVLIRGRLFLQPAPEGGWQAPW